MKKCCKVIVSIFLIVYGNSIVASSLPPLHPRSKIVNEKITSRQSRAVHVSDLTSKTASLSLKQPQQLTVQTDISEDDYKACMIKYEQFVLLSSLKQDDLHEYFKD